MHCAGPVKILFGGTHLDCHACQLDDLARVWRDNMTAQNLAAGLAYHQLHQHPAGTAGERALHRFERRAIDLNRLLLAGVFLAQAHRADLWLGEDRGRDQLVIDGGGVAFEDGLHKRHPFADRDGREVHAVCHIANRVDGRDGSLAVIVDLDLAVASQRYADLFKAHIAAAGIATRGKEYLPKHLSVPLVDLTR